MTGGRTVPALLAVAARATPRRIGVADGRLALTWSEVAARVADATAILAEAGVGPGTRVAIALPNSVALVETLLAVLAAGATAVPIAASTRPAELHRLLEETPVEAMAATEETVRTLAPARTARLVWRSRGLALDRRPAAATSVPVAVSPRGETPALLGYSSGTMGRPHAVLRTHENLWWEAENLWSATRLGPGDTVLGIVPLSHAHGFGNALLAALRAGARLILRPRFLRRPTLDLLTAERVTVFPAVPFMVRMLALTDRRRRWDLGALRWCFSAGAPLVPEVFEAFRARFGIAVRQLYGTTEAGSITLNTAMDDDLDPVSVGTPVGTVRVEVVDANGGALPAGVEGEIVVRSPAAEGGANRPLRTRDRGHWTAGGALVLTGRTSLFINTGGNKVDPIEVEAALRLHPAVADVAVFGVPAPHGEQLVAAAVVARTPIRAETLRLHCRALLSAHKVPRLVTFRAALPRSPLGKVLIGQLLAESAP